MMACVVTDLDAWDERIRELVEEAYVSAGDGPMGSVRVERRSVTGAPNVSTLRCRRIATAAGFDVGCANGFLLATLPAWCSERGVTVEPFGLQLLDKVADLARGLRPDLADRIWTGSVMSWSPPRQFTYVTALEDQVPPDRLGALVDRLLNLFLEPGGRLIVSAYASTDEAPRDLFGDLAACGHEPDGRIYLDRPDRGPLITAWVDRSPSS
jgi:hypothetical protein